MRIENYIRLLGILIGVGVIVSYTSLNFAISFISQGHISSILIGMVEILRWSFGLLAAVLLWRVQPSAQWVLLFAFVCGLVGSWISFIPFAGYLMRFVDQSSLIQFFLVIQIPNLLLLLTVFYLFRLLRKSSSSLPPTE